MIKISIINKIVAASCIMVANLMPSKLLCFVPNGKAADENWAETQLAKMTSREKVAQLFMVTATSSADEKKGYSTKPWKGDPEYVAELIVRHKVGGIIVMGSQGLMEQHRKTVNYYQGLSDVPLLVGIDGEWLPYRIKDVPKMPFAMTMGAVQDENLLYQMGKERAEHCKALGAHIDFGPVLDVNTNPKNPIIGMRSFGDDPKNVARKAILFMRGLQDSGVIACGKHFLGHGDAGLDSHKQLPIIEHCQERLEQIEIYPFKAAIQEGLMAMMPGHLGVPAYEKEPRLPATLSWSIVTNLLRNQLGFDGLVITDALPMGALDGFPSGVVELKALLAGNDMLLCSSDVPAAIDYIMHALEKGEISLQAIQEKALRVLKAKQWIRTRASFFVTQKELARIHAPQAHALKQQIFDQAITYIAHASQAGKVGVSSLTDSSSELCLLQVGAPHEKDFKHTLAHYTQVKDFYSSWWVSQAAIEALYKNVKESERIVISLYDPFPKQPEIAKENVGWHQWLLGKLAAVMYVHKKTTQSTVAPSYVGITLLLEKLVADGKQLTLVVFGSPYTLEQLKKYGEVILAYEADPCAQRAAARVLCGKQKAIGRLPIQI